MRQSCKIASEAFQQTIKYCADKCSKDEALSEHQIWAKVDYEWYGKFLNWIDLSYNFILKKCFTKFFLVEYTVLID